MLQLKNIVKTYAVGAEDQAVHALRGVDLAFRDSEFVAVLGPSGCGKTTLLNILGGLDRYTDGDLIINGRSTKEYNDGDWDTYRNHSIGFVFQSYNLIPHQTVLANVELALTLSGVSRAERRRRATEALEKVGLGDQIHKKPNQMSGGQMQRVAIARALVNDPDILLADEPTGALDTTTSVQIMEILKEISKDKLILMVTHNPELAETYANRIVRLVDGQVTGDSNPYTADEAEADAAARRPAQASVKKTRKKAKKDDGTGKGKRSMSFATALSLSFQNLMTKKGRTLLTSFAGSIGIIGIALILALSNGVNLFIATVQEDTLSTYPLSIQKETQDLSALLGAMTSVDNSVDYTDSGMIHVDDSLGTMMNAMNATVSNNLTAFKAYLEAHADELKPYVNDIQYTYDFDLQVFTSDGKTQVNPTEIFDNMGSAFSGMTELMSVSGMSSMGMGIMSEMINNQALLDQQYDVIAGKWPTSADEVVLVVSSNNQISKMTLYMLGVLDQSELEDIMKDLMENKEYDTTPMDPYTYDDFLNMSFRLLNTADFFTERKDMTYTVDGVTYPVWEDVREGFNYDQESFVTENGIELKIAGIVRPKKGVAATSISGAIGYTKALTDYILEQNAESKVINQQKATPEYNVLTGLKFERTVYTKDNIDELIRTIDSQTMDALYAFMTEQLHAMFAQNPPVNAESFMGFAAMMNTEQLSALISQMLEIAKADPANGTSLKILTEMVLTQMMPGVSVTVDNLVTLLPAMSLEQILVAIGGVPKSEQVPMDIKGLQVMCGEEAMAGIYGYMNEQLLLMSVDDTNFPTLLRTMDDEQFGTLQDKLYDLAPKMDADLESNLKLLGDAEKATPASVNFYAVDFESKEFIEDFIKRYNDSREDEKDKLQYTDVVGNMMSSVTIIVDAISYVLIAFVSISLVVSSIMIGIITYISVLERTKEIGILRAIGASKKDISRVFNAETLIIGFAAGVIGILFTVLACIPVTLILRSATGIASITAALPWAGAIALIIISMLLTFVAGLFPAGVAARKDPVIALRTE